MKTEFKTVVAIAMGMALFQTPTPARAQNQPALTNQNDKVSYAVGMYVGSQILRRNGIEVDLDMMIQGIKETLHTNLQPRLTEQQAQEVLAAYQQELRVKREEMRVKIAEQNRKQGDAFLAANRSKQGVTSRQASLPEGGTTEWQLKVLKNGTGSTPKATDTITVNFRGTLLNGTEFDGTAKRGTAPTTKLPLGRFAGRGLIEALQSMNAGSKWIVYIPSSLAYGDYATPNIEPGSLLTYEIEMLEIEAGPPPAPTPDLKPLTSDIIKVPSREELEKGAKIEVIKAEDAEKQAQSNAPSGTKP